MKALLIIVAVVLASSVFVSRAADEGSRPPGVLARDWVRVSERLGFVITHTDDGVMPQFPPSNEGPQTLRAPPDRVAADLMPPLKGYFVIQTPTGWRQVVNADPASLPR